MNNFNKYLGYCGCIAGALSVFLFVVLPAIIYGIFPQLGPPVEHFLGSIDKVIHVETLMGYIFPPLLVFLVVGVPLISFSPLWLGYFRDRSKISRLKQVGVKGTATIVAIQDTGITMNYSPYVRMTLEIEGLHAQVQMNAFVGRISFPRVGEKMEVMYDPNDPKVIMPASRM